MPIYGSDPIAFEGVTGDRYWFDEPFAFTGVDDVDERLSGFPVAVFVPQHRPTQETPLVIGLQGMAAPYGWNAFIVPTLLQMGIAVALFDTPLAGERSLVRSFTGVVGNEIRPLIDRGIPFNTELLLSIFQQTAADISRVRNFCGDRYGLNDSRVALFGVSMGVLQAAYAFTAEDFGERLLGTIGHGNLQSFAKSWGKLFLPSLAASPLGKLAEVVLDRVQPELKSFVKVLQLVKNLKYPDEYGRACNPMSYIERVKPPRRVRFLLGANDSMVSIRDARDCAKKFPDGACYVVPGMGHGLTNYGRSFVDHTRYFLVTQLEDWRG
jgi:pimeloyl-ACP methyl ester carboxylesterase